jgi:hypothetical protein
MCGLPIPHDGHTAVASAPSIGSRLSLLPHPQGVTAIRTGSICKIPQLKFQALSSRYCLPSRKILIAQGFGNSLETTYHAVNVRLTFCVIPRTPLA